MTYTKEQIVKELKSLNSAKIDIFKSKKDNDFSLTQHGYFLLTSAKLYSSTFVAKLDKMESQTTSTLISLKKIFDKTPYFLNGSKVFYFDEVIHTQICIHGGLSDYIKHLKIVEKFNR